MRDNINLVIDDRKVTVNKGKTVLEAALENDIYIPHLCYHPDLEPAGVCRLCLVDIEGMKKLATACKTIVEEGMIVKTENPEINKIRKTTIELLIANHKDDCLSCDKNTDCKLQDVAKHMGIKEEHLLRLKSLKRDYPIDDSNPFFVHDPNKCILCGICVQTCEQIQGVSAIDFASRGFDTTISTFKGKPWIESSCESCGECVIRCPVGALLPKNFREPTREVKTICPYCGCGCGISLGVRSGKIVSAHGERDNPANRGRLCVKGRFGYSFVNHQERLTSPMIKKRGEFVEVTWEEALDFTAEGLGKYRGDQFAAIASAKISNEENYVIQKFTRAVMGTNNIDHCARLCHAPSVAGLAQSLGSGAMTNSINEIGSASCIFAIGTNTTTAHPIIGLQIRNAVREGAKLIVINPREIELCRTADIFLKQRPGSDVALLMGMMRVIVDEELHDKAFIDQRCENFEAFCESLKDFSPDFVEKISGIPWEKIAETARIYATAETASILYSMGITQHSHGTDNVLATSNLALLTGNIGKPSTGVNPLRGQNNVQGACDMGALPNVYPGYKKVDNTEVKDKFEKAWGCKLNGSPGLTHIAMFDAVHQGKIKAMYLVGENPILSEANSKHTEAAIKKLGFFVVQDIFLTETAQLADVVLPATTFAEKDGTVTNTERRVQLMHKAIEPVGKAESDWRITCMIAKKLGARGFDFLTSSDIMEEISSLTPSYKGISYDRLEKGGLQWPCPTREHPGTPILHTEQFATESGKGKFLPLSYKSPAEMPDDEYPLILTTERSLYHFHTSTMTRKVEGLNILRKEELVEINPEDASGLQITDGEIIRVISRRGDIKAMVKITDISPPGTVSMTFHFAESPTNVITNSALDPVAKTPETKVCAVRLEKLND